MVCSRAGLGFILSCLSGFVYQKKNFILRPGGDRAYVDNITTERTWTRVTATTTIISSGFSSVPAMPPSAFFNQTSLQVRALNPLLPNRSPSSLANCLSRRPPTMRSWCRPAPQGNHQRPSSTSTPIPALTRAPSLTHCRLTAALNHKVTCIPLPRCPTLLAKAIHRRQYSQGGCTDQYSDSRARDWRVCSYSRR